MYINSNVMTNCINSDSNRNWHVFWQMTGWRVTTPTIQNLWLISANALRSCLNLNNQFLSFEKIRENCHYQLSLELFTLLLMFHSQMDVYTWIERVWSKPYRNFKQIIFILKREVPHHEKGNVDRAKVSSFLKGKLGLIKL